MDNTNSQQQREAGTTSAHNLDKVDAADLNQVAGGGAVREVGGALFNYGVEKTRAEVKLFKKFWKAFW